MGFTNDIVEFLETAEANFTTTMTLGRQAFHRTSQWPHGEWVDPFLEQLGAKEVRSLDVSAYEGATDIWDLNDPLPEHLLQQFSTVIDGGVLMYVFDFAQGLRNAMELVAPGGTLFISELCNNFAGGNFYQCSPDLFFRSLSKENGFEIRRLLLKDRRGGYELADPFVVGKRLSFTTHGPAALFVEARRVSTVTGFVVRPQVSQYQIQWAAVDPNWRQHIPPPRGLRRLVPDWAKRARHDVERRALHLRELYLPHIGHLKSTKRLPRHLKR